MLRLNIINIMNLGKTYLGTAEEDFKKRYNSHTNSFRHER